MEGQHILVVSISMHGADIGSKEEHELIHFIILIPMIHTC